MGGLISGLTFEAPPVHCKLWFPWTIYSAWSRLGMPRRDIFAEARPPNAPGIRKADGQRGSTRAHGRKSANRARQNPHPQRELWPARPSHDGANVVSASLAESIGLCSKLATARRDRPRAKPGQATLDAGLETDKTRAEPDFIQRTGLDSMRLALPPSTFCSNATR